MINVCVFGDSVAKGVVFDEEKKKYIFLGDNFLKLVQERQSVKFRNFAKFGCTPFLRKLYVRRVLQRV